MNIEVSQLTKKFGSRTVLNIPSLFLEGGKIIGLSGANGTGKTTLLRIIAGLDKHYQGTISYNGQSILSSDLRQQMTYLSQKPYRMEGSVKENIRYPLLLRKVDEKTIEHKVMSLMEELGLRELSSQKAKNLSGGEAQKMALARALVFEPQLLLLDEPTASIDAQTISQIDSILKKRNRDHQTTMIMISHSREQLNNISDILYEMEGGLCIQSEL